MEHLHGTIDAPPERYTTSLESEAKRHPITGPMLHNATRSPLARLPENILIRIMEHADDVTVLCLRRTCRTMLWLLSSGVGRHFDRFFDGSFCQDLPRRRKYISRPEKVPEAAKKPLGLLLQRDMYCEFCRSAHHNLKMVEKRLRSKRLYCSGCKRRHPAGLFSQEQRHSTSDRDRICIGREGYIRVCQHHTISWADVEAFMASSTRRVHRVFCNDRSHKSIFAEWPCREEHDHRVSVELNKDSRPMSLPRCSCWEQRVSRKGRRGAGQAWLHINWSTHIRFSRGRGENSNVLGYDDALSNVEWARNTAGGSYIFQDPPAGGGSKFPMEMQCFDPNVFPYLDLPPPPPQLRPGGAVSGLSLWKWPRRGDVTQEHDHAHSHSHGHERANKKNQDREAGKKKVYQVSFSSKVQDWQRNRGNHAAESLTIERCDNGNQIGTATAATRFNSCLVFHYRKSIPLNGPSEQHIQHLPSCRKNLAPVQGNGGHTKNKVLLTKKKPSSAKQQIKSSRPQKKTQTQPWSAAWFMSLDPDSINLRGDTESQGIYWCNTRSCLNYHEDHRHNRKRRALDVDDEKMGTTDSSDGLSRTTTGETIGLSLRGKVRALFGFGGK